MNKPLVSVIVPTYNRAYCLGATIDSVLAQTYDALELLIIDDGSSDQTRELVENQYGYDPRVRYVYQTNAGVSAARNHGFRLAQGEFVALIDSDDLWEPWKLELQIAAFDRLPQAGMIWTDMRAIDAHGQPLSDRYLRTMYSAYDYYPTADSLFPSSFSLRDIVPHLPESICNQRAYVGNIFSPMIMGNLVHTSTVLMRRQRREQVGFFREDFRNAGEDYEFHLRTCRAGTVGYLDVSSIIYQVGRPDQITVRHGKEMATNFLKTVLPILRNDGDRVKLPPAMIREMLVMAHNWVGEKSLDAGDKHEASKAFLTSLRLRPLQPRVLGFFLLSLAPFHLDEWLRRNYRASKRILAKL